MEDADKLSLLNAFMLAERCPQQQQCLMYA